MRYRHHHYHRYHSPFLWFFGARLLNRCGVGTLIPALLAAAALTVVAIWLLGTVVGAAVGTLLIFAAIVRWTATS